MNEYSVEVPDDDEVPDSSPITSTTNTSARKDWPSAFASAMASGRDLTAIQIPPRPKLMGPWMKRGDLGMIYASRGVGKTWMTMMIAQAISDGNPLGEWGAGEMGPLKVLYVDGEMNLEDSKERTSAIKAALNGGDVPGFLHHETLPDGCCFNLADAEQQESLLALVVKTGVQLLILDNLSSLCRGMKENDNDEWEKMNSWLRRFRRAKVTVILIHHEGRGGGGARGASKREDEMQWVMRLTAHHDATNEGAAFTSEFTKCRNCKEYEAPPLDWKVTADGVDCERGDDMLRVIELVKDGFNQCSEIAEMMGCSRGQVSKVARRAMRAGKLDKSGQRYAIPG